MYNKCIIDLYSKQENNKLLLAFPFAGASGQIFSCFQPYLPSDFNLLGIQYPGRGTLIDKPLIYNIDEMIHFLQSDIMSCFTRYQSVWVYGHSFGALIAYEMLSFFYENNMHIDHCKLNIGACPAPNQIYNQEKIHHLPDNEFLTELIKGNGLQKEFTSNRSLMKMYLPVLRADFTLYETYQNDSSEIKPLSIPIKVFAGKEDNGVNIKELEGWSKLTTSNCELIAVSGDHFFLNNQAEHIILKMLS